MSPLQSLLRHGIAAFDLVALSYFFLGNGVYTFLMLLSLRATWVHMRQMAYQGLDSLRRSPLTPPVTIIIPAWNEQGVILNTVASALQTDYPNFQVIVVDDGSPTRPRRVCSALPPDGNREMLHPGIPTAPVRAFYSSPRAPQPSGGQQGSRGQAGRPQCGNQPLLVTVFLQSRRRFLLERDALLRLMDPIVNSAVPTVVSGGIVRIVNGCDTRDGRVLRVGLPKTWLERFQVVEYLRSFLFGRTGWHLLGGTLIVSGAFAIFHRTTVIEAGGFCHDTVTEDMDLIVQLHQWAAENNREIRMSFTSDPVCWTECPSTLAMLAHQRTSAGSWGYVRRSGNTPRLCSTEDMES